MFPFRCPLVVLCCLALTMLSGGPAAADITGELVMQSDAGDPIGEGRDYRLDSPTNRFWSLCLDRSGNGAVDVISVRVEEPGIGKYWSLQLAADELDADLRPGNYQNAQGILPGSGRHPAFSVSGNSNAGAPGKGSWFKIKELVIDYSDVRPNFGPRLARLVVTFEQHHQGRAAALRGTLVYTAAPGPTAGPDLTGYWSTLQRRRVRHGRLGAEVIQGSIVVTNQGTVTAPECRLMIYSTERITWLRGARAALAVTIPALRPGEQRRLKIRLRLPVTDPARERYVITHLDGALAVPELEENNNLLVLL